MRRDPLQGAFEFDADPAATRRKQRRFDHEAAQLAAPGVSRIEVIGCDGEQLGIYEQEQEKDA